MNKNAIFIIIAAIIGVVGFLVLTEPKKMAGTPSNHRVGAGDSGVILTEFGDFQCPGCGSYYPIVKQIKEKYGDQITFQFRHFPLESIHTNARAAARAAEAAAKQNKFWEMHDLLFETQPQWEKTSNPISTFEGFAEQIGLDKARFTEDYKNPETSATITADLQIGREKGVASTPTFMIGDNLIDTPNTLDDFIKLIDAEIAKKKADGDSGSTQKTEE